MKRNYKYNNNLDLLYLKDDKNFLQVYSFENKTLNNLCSVFLENESINYIKAFYDNINDNKGSDIKNNNNNKKNNNSSKLNIRFYVLSEKIEGTNKINMLRIYSL